VLSHKFVSIAKGQQANFARAMLQSQGNEVVEHAKVVAVVAKVPSCDRSACLLT
jgi:hypothetical protein